MCLGGKIDGLSKREFGLSQFWDTSIKTRRGERGREGEREGGRGGGGGGHI